MFIEVDVLGAFVPIIIVQLAACAVIFVIADALLTKTGFFRLFWHASLGPLRAVCPSLLRGRPRFRRQR